MLFEGLELRALVNYGGVVPLRVSGSKGFRASKFGAVSFESFVLCSRVLAH